MSLYKEFKSTKRAELQKILKKKNIHEVPVVDKVVISMGIGSLATRKGVKDFSDLEKNLATIAGQKPNVIKSRKSISNFKLRENMPVMLRVTLRREKAYDFIERFVKLVLPRVRDFNGISPRKFDGKGNLNLGYPNQSIFAELNPEEIVTSQGVQINISTTTTVDVEAKELLKVLGIIFIEK